MSKSVAKAVVPKRRNAYGEWVVRAYDADGRRMPDADYYTDDLADAQATAELMVRPA